MLFVVRKTGVISEDTACDKCSIAFKEIAGEVFTPKYEALKKRDGNWVIENKLLFPGYLLIDLDSQEKIRDNMRLFAGYGEPLVVEGYYQHLSGDDQEILMQLLNNERIIEFSRGNIYDGKLTVFEGPLQGMEHLVSHIDRHKRLAWIDTDCKVFSGIKVGLAVLEKES